MQRKVLILLIVVTAVAGILRFTSLSKYPPGLYPDEAMNGNNALEALKTGNFKVFYPENNGREALFINIQAFFMDLVGEREPWVLRFPSAVIGTLTVVGFFLLLLEFSWLMRLRSPLVLPFLGSFFMATSFWHIVFSRIGFRAIMAPFFLIWAGYGILLAFRKHWSRGAIFGGLMLGLGAHSYIAYRGMIFIFLALIPRFKDRKEFWHVSFLFAGAALVAVLPLLAFFFGSPADFLGRTAQVSVFSSDAPIYDLARNLGFTLQMFFWNGDGNWRHNLAGEPQLFLPVALLFLFGVIAAFRKPTVFDYFFGSWFLLGLLPVIISNEGLPHALRAILLIPPVFAFAARGGYRIYEWWTIRRMPKPVTMVILISILLILLLQAGYTYFFRWGPHTETYHAFSGRSVELGRILNGEVPHERYVVLPGGTLVRGIPMPSQTIMFMTDTFLPEDQARKRIRYLTHDEYDALKSSLDPKAVFFLD